MRYCCLCCCCCCCLRVSDERERRVEEVKIEMGFEETRRDGAEEEACQMVLKRGEERLGATCGLEEDGRGRLWRGSVVIVRWYVLEPSAALRGCAPRRLRESGQAHETLPELATTPSHPSSFRAPQSFSCIPQPSTVALTSPGLFSPNQLPPFERLPSG